MTALMVGHAIFTTGKNTPTPGTGTRMRRVFACDHNRVRLSCFACHRMYRLWWRDPCLFCASRYRYISAQVLHIIVSMFVLCFCQVRSNTTSQITWLLFVLVFEVELIEVYSQWLWPSCKCSPRGVWVFCHILGGRADLPLDNALIWVCSHWSNREPCNKL